MDIEALTTLSQQVEDKKSAVDCQGDGGRVPDQDVAQQMNLSLKRASTTVVDSSGFMISTSA